MNGMESTGNYVHTIQSLILPFENKSYKIWWAEKKFQCYSKCLKHSTFDPKKAGNSAQTAWPFLPSFAPSHSSLPNKDLDKRPRFMAVQRTKGSRLLPSPPSGGSGRLLTRESSKYKVSSEYRDLIWLRCDQMAEITCSMKHFFANFVLPIN